MIRDFGLSHISFIRVQDLLPNVRTACDAADMTEGDYLVEAPQFRQALSATDIGSWDVEDQIKTDEGTLRTYCGYVRFLELDVEEHQNIPVADGKQGVSFRELSRKAQKRYIHVVAKKMMDNGAVSIIVNVVLLQLLIANNYGSASLLLLQNPSPLPSALVSTVIQTLAPSLPSASMPISNSPALL
jgi:hypothetical protein